MRINYVLSLPIITSVWACGYNTRGQTRVQNCGKRSLGKWG
jgi:hypothetical protein